MWRRLQVKTISDVQNGSCFYIIAFTYLSFHFQLPDFYNVTPDFSIYRSDIEFDNRLINLRTVFVWTFLI